MPQAINPTTASSSKPQPWPALIPLGHHGDKPPIPLMRPVTLVGSRQNAHLHLLSRHVSKAHALILSGENQVYVRDLASRTHVYVNDREVAEAYLNDGDLLKIGSFTFRYQAAAGAKQRAKPDSAPAAMLSVDGEAPVKLDQRVILIGRRPTCDLPLVEDSVSTAHAVIFSLGGKRYVRDLGSRTGTFVNDKADKQQELNFGDSLRIGETVFEYVPDPRAKAKKPPQPAPVDEVDELEDLVGTAPLSAEENLGDEISRTAEEAPAAPPQQTLISQNLAKEKLTASGADDVMHTAAREAVARADRGEAADETPIELPPEPDVLPVDEAPLPVEEIAPAEEIAPVEEVAAPVEEHAVEEFPAEPEPLAAEEPVAEAPEIEPELEPVAEIESEPLPNLETEPEVSAEAAAVEPAPAAEPAFADDSIKKSRRRGWFGFGRRKEEEEAAQAQSQGARPAPVEAIAPIEPAAEEVPLLETPAEELQPEVVEEAIEEPLPMETAETPADELPEAPAVEAPLPLEEAAEEELPEPMPLEAVTDEAPVEEEQPAEIDEIAEAPAPVEEIPEAVDEMEALPEPEAEVPPVEIPPLPEPQAEADVEPEMEAAPEEEPEPVAEAPVDAHLPAAPTSPEAPIEIATPPMDAEIEPAPFELPHAAPLPAATSESGVDLDLALPHGEEDISSNESLHAMAFEGLDDTPQEPPNEAAEAVSEPEPEPVSADDVLPATEVVESTQPELDSALSVAELAEVPPANDAATPPTEAGPPLSDTQFGRTVEEFAGHSTGPIVESPIEEPPTPLAETAPVDTTPLRQALGEMEESLFLGDEAEPGEAAASADEIQPPMAEEPGEDGPVAEEPVAEAPIEEVPVEESHGGEEVAEAPSIEDFVAEQLPEPAAESGEAAEPEAEVEEAPAAEAEPVIEPPPVPRRSGIFVRPEPVVEAPAVEPVEEPAAEIRAEEIPIAETPAEETPAEPAAMEETAGEEPTLEPQASEEVAEADPVEAQAAEEPVAEESFAEIALDDSVAAMPLEELPAEEFSTESVSSEGFSEPAMSEPALAEDAYTEAAPAMETLATETTPAAELPPELEGAAMMVEPPQDVQAAMEGEAVTVQSEAPAPQWEEDHITGVAGPLPEVADEDDMLTGPMPEPQPQPGMSFFDMGASGFLGGLPLQLEVETAPPPRFGNVTVAFKPEQLGQPAEQEDSTITQAAPGPYDQVKVTPESLASESAAMPEISDEDLLDPNEPVLAKSRLFLPKRPVPPPPARSPRLRREDEATAAAAEAEAGEPMVGKDVFGGEAALRSEPGAAPASVPMPGEPAEAAEPPPDQAQVFGGLTAAVRQADVFGTFSHDLSDDPTFNVAAIPEAPKPRGRIPMSGSLRGKAQQPAAEDPTAVAEMPATEAPESETGESSNGEETTTDANGNGNGAAAPALRRRPTAGRGIPPTFGAPPAFGAPAAGAETIPPQIPPVAQPLPAMPVPERTRSHWRLWLGVLLMLGFMAGSVAAVYYLPYFAPKMRFQSHLLFQNADQQQKPSVLAALHDQQQQRLTQDTTMLNARNNLAIQHPDMKPGFLDDPIAASRIAINWPQPGRMQIQYTGHEAGDGTRLAMLTNALFEVDHDMIEKFDAAQKESQSLAKQIAEYQQRVDANQSAREKANTAVAEAPTTQQMQSLQDQVDQAETAWKAAVEASQKAEQRLKELQQQVPAEGSAAATPVVSSTTEPAAVSVEQDPQYLALQKQLDDAQAKFKEAQQAAEQRAADQQKILADQMAATQKLLGDLQNAAKTNPDLDKYISGAQTMLDTMRKMSQENIERQQKMVTALLELKHRLDDEIESRRQEAYNTDAQLKQLQDDYAMRLRGYNAAVNQGYDKEAAQIKKEMELSQLKIDGRKRDLAKGVGLDTFAQSLEQVVSESQKQLDSDRAASEQKMKDMQDQFQKATATAMQSLPDSQKQLVQKLQQQLADQQDQYKKLSGAVDARTTEANAELRDLQDQVKGLTTKRDERRHQLELAGTVGASPTTASAELKAQAAAAKTDAEKAKQAESKALNDLMSARTELQTRENARQQAAVQKQGMEGLMAESDRLANELDLLKSQQSAKGDGTANLVRPEKPETDAMPLSVEDSRPLYAGGACGGIAVLGCIIMALSFHKHSRKHHA